jgi:hypothetical protein
MVYLGLEDKVVASQVKIEALALPSLPYSKKYGQRLPTPTSKLLKAKVRR